jgi:hypothetical protein
VEGILATAYAFGVATPIHRIARMLHGLSRSQQFERMNTAAVVKSAASAYRRTVSSWYVWLSLLRAFAALGSCTAPKVTLRRHPCHHHTRLRMTNLPVTMTTCFCLRTA